MQGTGGNKLMEQSLGILGEKTPKFRNEGLWKGKELPLQSEKGRMVDEEVEVGVQHSDS